MSRLPVAYDLVMILDGLTSTERERGGTSRSLARFLCQRGVDHVWAHAGLDDPEEIQKSLLDALGTCRRKAVGGARFPVHLVCRGNQEGVVCGSGRGAGLLTWDELSDRLEVINRVMYGTLLVNISSCSGIQGGTSIRPTPLKKPSYAMVGLLESASLWVVRRSNELFYEKLIEEGSTVQRAVRAVNRQMGRKVLYSIGLTGPRKLSKGLWDRHPGLRVVRLPKFSAK